MTLALDLVRALDPVALAREVGMVPDDWQMDALRIVWFGAVGEGAHVELTAIGDGVNITARLAAAAGAGEILVTSDAATAACLDPDLERRPLELKGKQGATEVVSLRVA